MTARLPTMVTLQDTGFVECRWWNDGCTVKTVVTWRSSAFMLSAPEARRQRFSPGAPVSSPPSSVNGFS